MKASARWLGRLFGPIADWHLILMHGSRCFAGDIDLPEPQDEDSEAMDK